MPEARDVLCARPIHIGYSPSGTMGEHRASHGHQEVRFREFAGERAATMRRPRPLHERSAEAGRLDLSGAPTHHMAGLWYESY